MVTLKHQHVASIATVYVTLQSLEVYKHADFDRANELLCDMDWDNILNSYDIQMSCTKAII